MFRVCWSIGVLVLALACAGCGSRTIKVSGTLLKDGKAMVVSEDTYVTLSFIPAVRTAKGKDDPTNSSYSAKFVHKSGTYTVEMPPGTYKTMLVIAPPSGTAPKGKLNAPKPITPDKHHELTRSQSLDIDVSGK